MLQHSKYEANRVGTAPLGDGKFELSLLTLDKLFENTAKNYSIK